MAELSDDALTDVRDLGRALRQLVRRARETTGRRLTCRELAKQTGYGRSAISNWLAGRSLPSADRLSDLMVAIGATHAEQRALATARDDIEEGRLAAPRLTPGEVNSIIAAVTDAAQAGGVVTIFVVGAVLSPGRPDS